MRARRRASRAQLLAGPGASPSDSTRDNNIIVTLVLARRRSKLMYAVGLVCACAVVAVTIAITVAVADANEGLVRAGV